MQGLIILSCIFFITSPSVYARTIPQAQTIFNVIDYGAVGDGQTDDSQAFLKAWENVCGASQGTPTLNIPQGKTFMLGPVEFQGPCKSNSIQFQLQGTLVAPTRDAWKGDDKWIQFLYVDGLIINGGGLIDGQGASWWESCINCDRPTALSIHSCNGSQITEISHLNSARNHISINACSGVHVSKLEITAPDDSPNTDGIDISHSNSITIENSTMGTGDDCVAINGGTYDINITNVVCGPGHGISIGSLGANGAYETVEDVHVKGCLFKGSQNGVRIKTWPGGSGYARNISFEQITLVGARHPIIIDQYYFSSDKNSK
ncbi:probable polygalacturonase At3g15720, partial [Fagus crenata]